VIAKSFELDQASLAAASLLRVEISRNVEPIEGCVGDEPRFHQALIRLVVNSLLQSRNCIKFRTATQDAGGVVAMLARDEPKSKSSVDAVVYSFKGITSAGEGIRCKYN
jgi:hypothetical protein